MILAKLALKYRSQGERFPHSASPSNARVVRQLGHDPLLPIHHTSVILSSDAILMRLVLTPS